MKIIRLLVSTIVLCYVFGYVQFRVTSVSPGIDITGKNPVLWVPTDSFFLSIYWPLISIEARMRDVGIRKPQTILGTQN